MQFNYQIFFFDDICGLDDLLKLIHALRKNCYLKY